MKVDRRALPEPETLAEIDRQPPLAVLLITGLLVMAALIKLS